MEANLQSLGQFFKSEVVEGSCFLVCEVLMHLLPKEKLKTKKTNKKKKFKKKQKTLLSKFVALKFFSVKGWFLVNND